MTQILNLAIETTQRQRAHKQNLPGAGYKSFDFPLFRVVRYAPRLA
ncbi:MAG: hypothetical protein LDL41_20520 [Coleofasciculus sp. S288]|nr:hypothetical protein [Coleofasciculus sp. S288]